MSSANSKASTPKNQQQPVLPPEYNWRILLVEDEPAIAEGIKSIIVPKNVLQFPKSSRSSAPTQGQSWPDQFEVIWAKNPSEALKAVEHSLQIGKPFAMGFFDVMLGADIDGIELVRQIQALDKEIHAVFVTAYHDRKVDSINEFLGPNNTDRWDYMNKPFTDGSILQKARNSVALWNLKKHKQFQDDRLAEASRLLLQGERANTVAAVGRSVAHEFGNMLMQIVGNAEMALLKKDQTRMEQALATIMKAAENAASILGKFKKINGDNQSEHMMPISINQALDEAIELMAHEFKKRNIKVTKVKNEPVIAEANHHSLVQVFMNVFINATHVMPKGGQIDLSVTKTDKDIEVRIRDFGPGIPVDILPKVCEPMFTTKGDKGTGLGLAICKEIIEIEHAGELTIGNHPAKGAEVTIRIPKESSHGSSST